MTTINPIHTEDSEETNTDEGSAEDTEVVEKPKNVYGTLLAQALPSHLSRAKSTPSVTITLNNVTVGNTIENPDASTNHQGAQQHSAGVLHDGLLVRPNDLFQFAFHLADPETAILLLLFFCHLRHPFSITWSRCGRCASCRRGNTCSAQACPGCSSCSSSYCSFSACTRCISG